LLLLRRQALNPLERWPRAPGEDEGDESYSEEYEEEEEDGRSKRDPRESVAEGVAVDLDCLSQRIVELPVAVGWYRRLVAVEQGLLYSRGGTGSALATSCVTRRGSGGDSVSLFYYCFEKQRERTVTDGIWDFEVSADLRNVLIKLDDKRLQVISVAEARTGKPLDGGDVDGESSQCSENGGFVDIDSRVSVETLPSEEWSQMFYEVWRRLKTHFFDENMGGVDWSAVRSRYEALLRKLRCRTDLSDVVAEMVAELGASHVNLSEPAQAEEKPGCAMGFLGAETFWDADVGGYQVAKLVYGDTWDPASAGPLCRTGAIAEGAHLLAINRQQLTECQGVEQLLRDGEGRDFFVTFKAAEADKAAKAAVDVEAPQMQRPRTVRKNRKAPTRLRRPDGGRQASFVTVRVSCVGFGVEQRARYRDWVERNLDAVQIATSGRVGYIHIPDCERLGFAEFHRYFLVECQRDAIIVDLRGNQGGHISETLLDYFARAPLSMNVPRRGRGQVWAYPSNCVRNARTIVLLVDGRTSSDAESFAVAFRDLGLGTIVGARTWGGVLSIGECNADLVDGSVLSVPSEHLFSLTTRAYSIENCGVIPDVEVIVSPCWAPSAEHDMDSQLTRAVEEAERLLSERRRLGGGGDDAEGGDLLARCRRRPRTRAHLRWRVVTPELAA